ncbi:mTERF domain containing protein [Klebsormidium nitens]|uniref:mTERF domain containing protein n=1 Tax=Klebsormidium nitens TaxID=105231 RepID=A0A1Y1II02_KLENI|nr:mTERF domain containing protein [Klebsormidium nitens]|eukprot:GAQ89702.1 mTERF domain containing protein [Klebsormidium nitens]
MRADAVARGFEAASKSAHDFSSSFGRQSSVFSSCRWSYLSSRPAGKQTERVRSVHTQSGRTNERHQAPMFDVSPKVVTAKKAAKEVNTEDTSHQRIANGGAKKVARAPLAPRSGEKTAPNANGRKRSTSPFAKLGPLLGEEAKLENSEGTAKRAYGRGQGAKAPEQSTGEQHERSGQMKGGKLSGKQDLGYRTDSDAVAEKLGGASQKESQASSAEWERGASSGPMDGVPSSSGRSAEFVGRKAHLRKAVSNAEPAIGMPFEPKNDFLQAERDKVIESSVCRKATSQRGAPLGPRSIELRSDDPESGSVTSADDEESDPLDWFDVGSLSDSETPDEDIPFSPPPKKLGSPPPSSEIIADLDPDAPILQPQRQQPPPRQRLVSPARQTADVSARRGATRVATSRILEASDFAERTSVDLLHWGGDADVAPAVPIYSKQRGGERGAQRPPWKRERHKAKTHEDHRRRALERKSQLALAGLPLHLEADDNEEDLELETEAKAEPKSEPQSYSGRRCEVCRRLKKGGCGTAHARPGCLKRLLLFPQAEEEEVEASTSFSFEDQAADEVWRSLGLPGETRLMCRYLHSLGLDRADLAKLLNKTASTFRLSVAPVKARVDFLRSIGVDGNGIRSLILRQPNVLRLRVDRVMQPRIDFLKRLGVPEDGIADVIMRNPSLLYVKEETLDSKVKFLTETIGIPQSKVVDIARRHPQIFVKNIEAGLQPTVDYFVKEVGVSRDAFAKMVSHHPQLLHYSLADGIKPRIEFLRSIGLTPEDTLICITRFAQVLSLSVDTCLRPKYEYLVTHLGGSPETIVKFPAYFSLSLNLRIIPRYKFLRELAPGEPFPTSLFMRFLRLKEDQFVSAVGMTARKQGLRQVTVSEQHRPRLALTGGHDDSNESNGKGRRIRREGEVQKQEGGSFELSVAEPKEAIAAATAFQPIGLEGMPGRFRRNPRQ